MLLMADLFQWLFAIHVKNNLQQSAAVETKDIFPCVCFYGGTPFLTIAAV